MGLSHRGRDTGRGEPLDNAWPLCLASGGIQGISTSGGMARCLTDVFQHGRWQIHPQPLPVMADLGSCGLFHQTAV